MSSSEQMNIAELIAYSPVHTTLIKLLKKYKLLSKLKNLSYLTVFAPTNDAFRSIKDTLSKMKDKEVKELLLSHILQYSKSPPPGFQKMKSFKTLSVMTPKIDAKTIVPILKKSNGLKVNNGTLYVISKVLT